MILCVAQIRWDDPPDAGTLKAGEEALQVIVGLELTDGWYRVRASIDSCLRSACERGKIVVGAKLGISGAKVSTVIMLLSHFYLTNCHRIGSLKARVMGRMFSKRLLALQYVYFY